MMCPRSSSRGRNTSASVTVTVVDVVNGQDQMLPKCSSLLGSPKHTHKFLIGRSSHSVFAWTNTHTDKERQTPLKTIPASLSVPGAQFNRTC